ncbi:MAG: YihY/virulence factor BrkB family protein [Beijerinckiaceae bacterium]|nr:YihY/virulence factor BrkB family protein [Beijerinckiaceae bacterium]
MKLPERTAASGTNETPRFVDNVDVLAEANRGRLAGGPGGMTLRGWRDVLIRAFGGVFEDRIFALAAGVAFYAVLAIFPAMAVTLSIYGLFADPTSVATHLELLAGVLPPGATEMLAEQMVPLTQSRPVLGWTLAGSFIISVWSANAGVAAFFDALNVMYREQEKRPLWRFYATSLLFTLLAIIFLAVALGAVVVFPVALNFFGWASSEKQIVALARWPFMYAILVLVLMVFYRYGPSRMPAQWRWVSWGSLIAGVLWILVSMAFSRYVASFDGYNRMYGSLGAIIAFMVWLWLSSVMALLGAKIDAEAELQTVRDTTAGDEKPLGQRGAFVADNLEKSP